MATSEGRNKVQCDLDKLEKDLTKPMKHRREKMQHDLFREQKPAPRVRLKEKEKAGRIQAVQRSGASSGWPPAASKPQDHLQWGESSLSAVLNSDRAA